jgi:outer membrane protein OmpA-like peptidoglycan-associated protein
MKKKYLPWLILGLILWIIFGFFFCRSCWFKAAAAVPAAKTVAAATTSGWLISDGARFKTTCDTGFDFNQESYTRIGNNSTDCLERTVSYLENNPNRELTITGEYAESETYNGILSNLGLARANNVKSYMMGLGVAASQLNTKSVVVPASEIENNVLEEGVRFSFGALSNDSASRLADIKARLIDQKPAVTLRFNTGQNSVNLTAQQRQDFSDIVYYLDNQPGSNVSIDGHTDNVGGLQGNINLSAERATFVKDYLVNNGISGSKMSTNGFGPNSPLNSNSTAAERALNRRVEVVLNHN